MLTFISLNFIIKFTSLLKDQEYLSYIKISNANIFGVFAFAFTGKIISC